MPGPRAKADQLCHTRLIDMVFQDARIHDGFQHAFPGLA
jgi:hypothetical protein